MQRLGFIHLSGYQTERQLFVIVSWVQTILEIIKLNDIWLTWHWSLFKRIRKWIGKFVYHTPGLLFMLFVQYQSVFFFWKGKYLYWIRYPSCVKWFLICKHKSRKEARQTNMNIYYILLVCEILHECIITFSMTVAPCSSFTY